MSSLQAKMAERDEKKADITRKAKQLGAELDALLKVRMRDTHRSICTLAYQALLHAIIKYRFVYS